MKKIIGKFALWLLKQNRKMVVWFELDKEESEKYLKEIEELEKDIRSKI